ncbi:MAG: hypothetical protein JWQ71_1187 [Pedosphaera sp.]|nr:hypothetical protein [Pedosphaera sp.]
MPGSLGSFSALRPQSSVIWLQPSGSRCNSYQVVPARTCSDPLIRSSRRQEALTLPLALTCHTPLFTSLVKEPQPQQMRLRSIQARNTRQTHEPDNNTRYLHVNLKPLVNGAQTACLRVHSRKLRLERFRGSIPLVVIRNGGFLVLGTCDIKYPRQGAFPITECAHKQ